MSHGDPEATTAPGLLRAEPMLVPPKSSAGVWTGAAGVIAAVAAIVVLRDWFEPVYLKAATVLGIAALAMVLSDVLVYRVHLSPTTGLAHQPLRPLDPLRLVQKLIGFWGTIGLLGAVYWVVPVYSDASFQPFWDAAAFLLPVILVVSPFYIAYVDRRQRDPSDAYAQLAMLISGKKPDDWNVLLVHARGWLIKGFFAPLMFSYVAKDLDLMWSAPILPTLDFEHIFSRLIDVFYLIDVLLAAVCYVLTLRVIDNQIRSAEPTVAGWVVCLLCYPPFNDVTGKYLPFDQDGLYWGKVFSPYPWLYVAWGSVILLLVFVYAWSTAAFGLRFSNLTNRGIITNGPYRWTKHPAYLSKNLSWWLISVPFIAGAGATQAIQSCLLLGGVSLIYFLRARTEERHLSADPNYRDYREYISRHGLFARVIRTAATRIRAQAS